MLPSASCTVVLRAYHRQPDQHLSSSCSCQTDCSESHLYQEHMRCAWTQVAEGDVLHDGHRAKADMEVAVIYHGYTDA